MKITRTVATPFSCVVVVIYKKRPKLIRCDQTPKGQTVAIPRGINADGRLGHRPGQSRHAPRNVALEGRETDGDFDGLLVDWKEKGHTVMLEGKETISGTAKPTS